VEVRVGVAGGHPLAATTSIAIPFSAHHDQPAVGRRSLHRPEDVPSSPNTPG
jgi:hypothetical protein